MNPHDEDENPFPWPIPLDFTIPAEVVDLFSREEIETAAARFIERLRIVGHLNDKTPPAQTNGESNSPTDTGHGKCN